MDKFGVRVSLFLFVSLITVGQVTYLILGDHIIVIVIDVNICLERLFFVLVFPSSRGR